jgi:hypothetical protein
MKNGKKEHEARERRGRESIVDVLQIVFNLLIEQGLEENSREKRKVWA